MSPMHGFIINHQKNHKPNKNKSITKYREIGQVKWSTDAAEKRLSVPSSSRSTAKSLQLNWLVDEFEGNSGIIRNILVLNNCECVCN